MTYLLRYEEFDEPEQMKRVVGLMHRQVVRTKAEGLYFRVSPGDLSFIGLGASVRACTNLPAAKQECTF